MRRSEHAEQNMEVHKSTWKAPGQDWNPDPQASYQLFFNWLVEGEQVSCRLGLLLVLFYPCLLLNLKRYFSLIFRDIKSFIDKIGMYIYKIYMVIIIKISV